LFYRIDAFGFSIKELRTGRVILRCNSAGDLYTISSAVPTAAHAMLAVSTSLWHRRLGHPGPTELASLRKNSLISGNKVDASLCHACQLGKHVRLPFSIPPPKLVHPLRLFIVMSGPHRFLAYLVASIT
jgi:hypothetical protein